MGKNHSNLSLEFICMNCAPKKVSLSSVVFSHDGKCPENKAAKVLVTCLSNGQDQDLLRNVFLMKLFMEQPNLSFTNLPPQRRLLHF